MHRCAFLLAALCAALLSTSRSHADTVAGTRSALLVEAAHHANITLAPGHAELVVERTLHNGGPRHDQATFRIDLPMGGVATELATLGMLGNRPYWYRGDLMEAEAAAERYRELTGFGLARPKDPALLSWISPSSLNLQVFPCFPGADKSVRYKLLVPTHYRDGAHHLELPRMGTRELAATARVLGKRGQLLLNGRPLSPDTPVPLEGPHRSQLSLVPDHQPQLGGALAVVPIGKKRVLTHYRIEAAPELSRVPDGAYVVVVLDGSHSLDEAESQVALGVARSFVQRFPGARVELLVFDRTVHSRLGGFVPVREALAAMDQLSIAPANGSDVDRALAAADALLATAPEGAPKRVLLLTDGRARSSLSPVRLAASFSARHGLLHIGIVAALNRDPVVQRYRGAAQLYRTDDHPWSAATRQTGGLVWRAEASDDAAGRDAMAALTEELARPIRIDRLEASFHGTEEGELYLYGSTLEEGQGQSATIVHTHRLRKVDLQGELWAQPVRATLRPDQREQRLWTALVFGSEALYQLEEDEMMRLAQRAGAVSPVTSYLAIEPGVRPSSEGLRRHRARPPRVRMGGTHLSDGRPPPVPAPFSLARYLRDELARRWSQCGGTSRPADVTLETTRKEIVDVSVVAPGVRAGRLERCLTEAAWQLQLPEAFRAEHEQWTVRVGAGWLQHAARVRIVRYHPG